MNYCISSIQQFFRTHYRESIIALITAFCAYILIHFTALRFGNDDQFILYRYVDNIVAGNGFVFNVGERVLGSTTPLFTLVCSFFKYFLPTIQTPGIVAGLNIIFLSLAASFFYRISRFFLEEKISWVAAFIFIFSLAKTIPEGMETPLFLLLFFIFLDALLRKKYYVSSIFLALTLLTRPDAGLVAVLVCIYWLQKLGWRQTFRLVVLTIAIALPWLVFSTLYFGSFVPQSLIAKMNSSNMLNISRLQGVKVQLAALSRLYWGKVYDPENIAFQAIFNLLPVLFFMAIAAVKKLNKDNWIIFIIPLVYFISFSVSNPIIFPWYISEMEPLWILISYIGITILIEKISNKTIQIVFFGIILLGPVFSYGQLVTTDYKGSKTSLFETAQYIKEHEKPGDSIGIGNIGIVGYITSARIVDFFGLVSPDSVHYYPITDACAGNTELYTIPPRLIQDSMPTWIEAGGEMQACFAQSDWFIKHYVVVRTVGDTAKIWKLRNKL